MLKSKIIFIILLYFPFLGFSQTQKTVRGKVVNQEHNLNNVEVINVNDKKLVRSNEFGEFSIALKPKDTLLFIAKDYVVKKVVLTQNEIDKNNVIVNLDQKAIELDEVKLFDSSGGGFVITKESIAKHRLEKQMEQQKLKTVYTGEILNGMDFMAIGKLLKNALKPKKKVVKVDLAKFVKSNFDEAFLRNNLKLKPEDVAPFFRFCEADSKLKQILDDENPLVAFDFLMLKKQEYDKIHLENPDNPDNP